MNPEIKKLWLERLKTGKKARGKLRNKTGGRCCFGHLCDLYDEAKGKSLWAKNLYGHWAHDGFQGLPNVSVRIWADFPVDNSLLDISWINDERPGFPIKEIEKL